MFDLLFIKIFILLIASGIGAYTDYKTGYIYNWITFPLIVIGFLFLIFESFIYNALGYLYFLKVIVITAIIYGVGYLFYYYGKLGGGDVKLFLGLNLLLPYVNGQLFILWVLIISSLSSVLIISVKYMFILSKKIKRKEMKVILRERRLKIVAYLLIFVIFTYFLCTAVNTLGFSKEYLFLLLPIFVGLFTVLFEEEIKKYIYLRNKPLKEVEEGDVVSFENLSEEIKKKLNMQERQVIEEKDMLVIKNLTVKTLPIYDNLPRFGPYILIGVIFSFVILYFFF